MPDETARITCRTPTPGKQPTRIDRWKYETIRKAILRIVPRQGSGVLFQELPGRVAAQLTKAEKAKLGSVSWYTTVFKLNLEVRRELRRVTGAAPQRLLRGKVSRSRD
jgi:hypothetical protein